MFDYYKRVRIHDIITTQQSNLDVMIKQITELPTSLGSPIEIRTLGSQNADQVISDELGSLDRVFPTTLEVVRNATPFQGYLPGSVVMLVSSPGTGKTATLIQEAINFSTQGFKVLFCALGDMMMFDFITRASSVITNSPFSSVVVNPSVYFDETTKAATSNIDVIIVPSKKISASEIQSIIESDKDKYDVIIIDYDSNLKDNTNPENMYHVGGEVYETATEIARPTNGAKARLVFIASQPKVGFWEEEILTLDSAGESSRKQHTVDMMITMGKVKSAGGHKLAMMNVPKNRRGSVDIKQGVIMSNSGRITSISNHELALYKGASV